MQRTKIVSKEEARQKAIDWQHWASGRQLSYAELADWAGYFRAAAARFGLVREFRENGII